MQPTPAQSATAARLERDIAEPELVGPFPPVPTEAQIDALLADARKAADAAGLPTAEDPPADSPLLAALRAAEERVLWMLERFATRSGPALIEWEQLREIADLLETARVEAEDALDQSAPALVEVGQVWDWRDGGAPTRVEAYDPETDTVWLVTHGTEIEGRMQVTSAELLDGAALLGGAP